MGGSSSKKSVTFVVNQNESTTIPKTKVCKWSEFLRKITEEGEDKQQMNIKYFSNLQEFEKMITFFEGKKPELTKEEVAHARKFGESYGVDNLVIYANKGVEERMEESGSVTVIGDKSKMQTQPPNRSKTQTLQTSQTLQTQPPKKPKTQTKTKKGKIIFGGDTESKMLYIYDIGSNTMEQSLELPGRVQAIERLEEGKYLLGLLTGNLLVYSVPLNRILETIEAHEKCINAIKVTPTGTVLTASNDKRVREWEIDVYGREGKQNIRTYIGHGDFVYCLAVMGESKFASGSRDSTIRIYDRGKKAPRDFAGVLRGHANWVNDIIYIGDMMNIEGVLLSSSVDGSVKFWGVEELVCIRTIEMNVVGGSGCKTLQPLSQGRFTVGLDNGDIRVYTDIQLEHYQTLRGHTDYVTAVAKLGDGMLATSSWDNSIRIWDIDTATCLHKVQCTNWLLFIHYL